MAEKTTYNKEIANLPALTADQIPPSYNRCFQSDCPMADTCTHFLAGQHIPEGQTYGGAIYPTARQNGDCKHYKQTRAIRAAYGFKALFAEAKQKDGTALRNRVKEYLGGHGTYYRYLHGERPLTPEQQEWILGLFRRNGYTENLCFDSYREIYDFLSD